MREKDGGTEEKNQIKKYKNYNREKTSFLNFKKDFPN